MTTLDTSLPSPSLSFEFFPPKTDKGLDKLKFACETLTELNPEFFSVTFGAGGSTHERTYDTIRALQSHTSAGIAPHISCLCHSKADIAALLERYKNAGVKRLVVLRGDAPQKGDASVNGEMLYANELVAFIREHSSDTFFIEVAAYPEFHPESDNPFKDIKHFQQKVIAGADSAITQYFYNFDAYRYFIDACNDLSINVPIVPGIMPITDYEKLMRFSACCGAEIPRWLRIRLEAYADQPESLRAFGQDVVTHLCEQLLDFGAPALHFYTLNQTEPSFSIAKSLCP